MAMVLWMLSAIYASFNSERVLLGKDETALKVSVDKKGKMSKELKIEDIANLPENVLALTIEIDGKVESKSLIDVKDKIVTGKRVLLAGNVTNPKVITAKRIAILKDNPPSEKIAVMEMAEWGGRGEAKNLTVEEIEKRFDDGYKLVLNADVQVNTWWYSSVFTVPGIDVPLSWGSLVVAIVFLACAAGTYKLLNKPRFADFLIESESELKRVDWPTKPEVVASTKVVVVVVILMMLILFVLDLVNATLIKDGLFKIFLPNT